MLRRLSSIICLSFSAAATLLSLSCSDELTGERAADGQLDGIALSLDVVEQADLIYETARTRAAGTPVLTDQERRANDAHALPLDAGSDLYVHRMPLPMVGIHPGTAGDTEADGNAGTTRAPLSEVAGGGIAFHDSLTIWGYTSGRTGGDLTLFNGITVMKVNGFRTACEWPYANAGTMRFYAIAPAKESLGEAISDLNTPAYATVPTFTYTVPDAPAEQRDLLYGSSADIAIATPGMDRDHIGADNRVVGMSFRHILTAVRFAQGKMPTDVTIKSITLTGIKNSGSYNGTAWSSQTGSANYTINVNHDVTDYDKSSENVYIDGGNVCLLMPHTLTAAEGLEIVLRKDGEATDRHLSVVLTGDVWQPGYTVTYKVTIGEMASSYYLVIDSGEGVVKPTPVNGESGSNDKYTQASGGSEYQDGAAGGTFTVHSFRNYLDYSSSSTPTNRWHNIGWRVAGYSTTKEGEYTAYSSSVAPSSYIAGLTIGSNSILDGGTTYTTGGTQTVSYTMANQTAAYSGSHQTILSANNNVTAGFNLSTTLPNGSGTDGDKMSGYTGSFRDNSIYNSANSYIVNAKGTYKFPLVYGNSYQAGSSIDLSGNTIFVDHNGKPIKHANILSQLNNADNYPATTEWRSDLTASEISTHTDATKKKIVTTTSYGVRTSGDITLGLIWQDVDGLFSGVTVGHDPSASEIGFANFVVSSTTKPGNCVIALKGKKYTTVTTTYHKSDDTQVGDAVVTNSLGDDEILWTWHIWCTDEVYPNAGDVDQYYPQYVNSSKIVSLKDASDAETAKILPVNLGWVPDNMSWNKYRPREVWVKLTQTGSDQVAYVKLRKEATEELVTGTSTIYQWGRPTALPMKAKMDGSSRTIYDASSDITSTFISNAINTPVAAIANPTKMGEGWNPSVAYWSTTEKTLYDPSPVGFRLPAGTDFSAFSLTGASTTSAAPNLNMWRSEGANSQGGYFFTKAGTSLPSDRYQPKVYMPATGTWTDSYVQGNLTNGYYWTGVSGTYLEVKPNTINGFINFGASTLGKGYAFPVRPKAQ